MSKHFSKSTLRLLLTGVILSSFALSDAGAMRSKFLGNLFHKATGVQWGKGGRGVGTLIEQKLGFRWGKGGSLALPTLRDRLQGRRPNREDVERIAGVYAQYQADQGEPLPELTPEQRAAGLSLGDIAPEDEERGRRMDEWIQRFLAAVEAQAAQQAASSSSSSSQSFPTPQPSISPPTPPPAIQLPVFDEGDTPGGGLFVPGPQEDGGPAPGEFPAEYGLGDLGHDELMQALMAQQQHDLAQQEAAFRVSTSAPADSSSFTPSVSHETPGWGPVAADQRFNRDEFLSQSQTIPVAPATSDAVFIIGVPEPVETLRAYNSVLLPGEVEPRIIVEYHPGETAGVSFLHLSGPKVSLADGVEAQFGMLQERLDAAPVHWSRGWHFGISENGKVVFVRNTGPNRQFLIEGNGLSFANGHRSLIEGSQWDGGLFWNVLLQNPIPNVEQLTGPLAFNVHRAFGRPGEVDADSIPAFDPILAFGRPPAYPGIEKSDADQDDPAAVRKSVSETYGQPDSAPTFTGTKRVDFSGPDLFRVQPTYTVTGTDRVVDKVLDELESQEMPTPGERANSPTTQRGPSVHNDDDPTRG